MTFNYNSMALRLRHIAQVLVLLNTAACGSSSSDGSDAPPPVSDANEARDANPDAPTADAISADAFMSDATVGSNCDPVANSGCPLGQKCTAIVDSQSPLDMRTDCAPDGDIPEDGSCFRDDQTGYDDCVGGFWCLGGRCVSICSQAPDNCPTDQACVQFLGMFTDRDNVGLCQPGCHPSTRAADCLTGEGCYPLLATGKSTCSAPGSLLTTGAACDGTAGTQGCDCQTLNGCEVGYGCVLSNAPSGATGLVCAYLCDPLPGGAGPSCANGPGASHSCRQVRTFYSNAGNVPADIGLCVDPAVWTTQQGCADPSQPGCS